MALLPGKEVDQSVAFRPDECGRLFHPGYLDCENGYCLHPDGYGFSAVRIDWPEVTPEMLPFMLGWYGANDVHYKTWLPDMHKSIFMHDPMKHRFFAEEDLGFGTIGVVLGEGRMLTPEILGIEDPVKADPDFVFAFGGTNKTVHGNAGPDGETIGYGTEYNYFRRKGNGIELRIRTFLNAGYIDGKYVLFDPGDNELPMLERTRLMACHNAWEYTRMGTLLPAVYSYAKENDLIPPAPNAMA